MSDQLVTIGLSNTCFALVLALVAMLVSAKAQRPQLSHLLWLLVLVKLVTPPLVLIPVELIPRSSDLEAAGMLAEIPLDASIGMTSPTDTPDCARPLTTQRRARADSVVVLISDVCQRSTPWLSAGWLLGSGVIFVWSLIRIFQFDRFLRAHTAPAPPELLAAGTDVARRLKLRKVPDIRTTSANVSPMVWWAGWRVRVIIPAALLEQLGPREWRWVLAHELAHVRRRDHLVRWLEWLARVGFWWNPLMPWAQRNLRAMEEICCDDLVISTLQPEPRSYANSILTAVESLARPTIRPPAMASEINSGGSLERRFNMMVSNRGDRSNSRAWQRVVLLGAVLLLPLGMATAQDYEAVEKRLGKAVSQGELTLEQAGAMMAALRQTGERRDLDRHGDTDAGKAAIKNQLREMGDRLKAKVAAGEITEDQAWADWNEFKERQIASRLRAAVDSGKMTEDTARAVMQKIENAEIDKRLRAAGGRREMSNLSRILHVLRKAGLQPEQAEKALGVLVPRGALTEEQFEQVQRLSRKLLDDQQPPQRERQRAMDDMLDAAAEIRKAVAEGEISEEAAGTRLAEALKALSARRSGGAERPDWDAIRRRIEGAVERGDMTRKEANAKYREIKQRMSADATKADFDWDAVKRRIEGAVERGDMTRDEADAKYREIKQRMSADATKADFDWDGVKRRIEGAVERGDMTREEADAKYREIKQRMSADATKADFDWDAVKRRIEGAVERGDMTREEADAKYREVKQRMSADATKADFDWDAVKRRIEGAVERGDMTRDEADAKYREIKQRMSADATKADFDWDAVKRRIEGAVERGDMTREEADAKYRELRE